MPKRKAESSKSTTKHKAASRVVSQTAAGDGGAGDDLPPSAGFLLSCDIPTKQYIQHLNELKPVDKKFILEDL